MKGKGYVRDLGSGRYLFQIYVEDGRFARGPASFQNKAEWAEVFNRMGLSKPEILNLLEMDPSRLAGSLPWVGMKVIHPVTKIEKDLMQVVIDLNDQHEWTREAIADWVETLPDVPKFEVP